MLRFVGFPESHGGSCRGGSAKPQADPWRIELRGGLTGASWGQSGQSGEGRFD
jgi:hypothetical protein